MHEAVLGTAHTGNTPSSSPGGLVAGCALEGRLGGPEGGCSQLAAPAAPLACCGAERQRCDAAPC